MLFVKNRTGDIQKDRAFPRHAQAWWREYIVTHPDLGARYPGSTLIEDQ
jgi:hypothetical protein